MYMSNDQAQLSAALAELRILRRRIRDLETTGPLPVPRVTAEELVRLRRENASMAARMVELAHEAEHWRDVARDALGRLADFAAHELSRRETERAAAEAEGGPR
jgi:hypothetical protein